MTVYIVYPHWASLHGWGMAGSPQIDRLRELARGKDLGYLPLLPEELKKAQAHLTSMRWDVGLGALVLLFVSASFLVAGAAVLHPRHLLPTGFSLLSHQKAIWEQISPVMVPIYYLSVLAALWGTLYALPEMYSRLTHEFLGALIAAVRRAPYRKVFLAVGLYIGVVCIFVIWSGMQPVTIMDVAATISTNLGIFLVCLGAFWLNCILPREYRFGKPLLVGLIVTLLMLALVSTLSLTQMGARLWGR